MRKAIIVLTGIILAGCAATGDRAPDAAVSSSRKLQIVFGGARHGETEACGCELQDLGGLDREVNQLARWKSAGTQRLFLTGGTTFVPSPESFAAAKSADYAKRAAFLSGALGEMGVDVVAPSSEDLVLGVKELKALEVNARYALVATNLYSKRSGKPIFKTFHTMTVGAIPVYIVGVSAKPRAAYAIDADVEVVSPVPAIHAVIDKLPAPGLVILVTNLGKEEREALQREVPGLNLVLGAAPGERESTAVSQSGAAALAVNPLDRGRALARIEMEARLPIEGFYNPAIAGDVVVSRAYWKEEIAKIDKTAKRKLGRSARNAAFARRAKLAGFLARTEGIPTAGAAGLTEYQWELASLGKSLAEPRNTMTAAIEKVRAGR